MKKETWRTDWHQVTNTEAFSITGSTASPGQVYPYPVNKLPSQLQRMPGLYAAYVSNYYTSSSSPEGVEVLGEVAAIRSDDGVVGKGYVYVFGVSGSGVYYNGPYKSFAEHHFFDTGSVPVERMFGNVPSFSGAGLTPGPSRKEKLRKKLGKTSKKKPRKKRH